MAGVTGGTPARGLLVFDGDCGFCTTSARFLASWVDRRHRYDVRPWQELDLAALGLTEDQCRAAAQFLGPRGDVWSGHRAVAQSLRRGAPGWRPLGRLMVLPGVDRLAARVYAWVADHRYALPGGTPACAPRNLAPPQ